MDSTDELTSIAHSLLDYLWDTVPDEEGIRKVEEKAIELIGLKAFLKYKLEKDYPLTSDDRNNLINYLNY